MARYDQSLTRLRAALDLAENLASEENPFSDSMEERAAREYDELNTILGGLTALRVLLANTKLLPPIEESVQRDPKTHFPLEHPSPRRQYHHAEAAIVEAEHAVMRIRDRNGWTGDRDKHGKLAASKS